MYKLQKRVAFFFKHKLLRSCISWVVRLHYAVNRFQIRMPVLILETSSLVIVNQPGTS